jgi:4-oxalocrotonate tautomerase
MPHLIVKLYPGRTEEQKKTLVAKLNRAVIDSLGVPEDVTSIAIEEIPKEEWDAVVRAVDILPKQNTIYQHSRSSRSCRS